MKHEERMAFVMAGLADLSPVTARRYLAGEPVRGAFLRLRLVRARERAALLIAAEDAAASAYGNDRAEATEHGEGAAAAT